jgi:hypothetical protein
MMQQAKTENLEDEKESQLESCKFSKNYLELKILKLFGKISYQYYNFQKEKFT